MPQLKTFYIKTFGCQMNYADSEKVHMILMSAGMRKVIDPVKADIVIMNTCSVRQKGEDRVFGMIQSIRKHHEKNGTKIPLFGITGCMVRQSGIARKYLEKITDEVSRAKGGAKKITRIQQCDLLNYDDNLFIRSPHIDFVFRIEEVSYLTKILSHITGTTVGNDAKFDDYLKAKQLRENPHSATIIIQTGCDNYCTFCIVPFTRGSEVSRPIDEIVHEAREAVNAGAKEITLVGQNVNSYGKQFVDKKYWNSEKSKWNDGFGKSPFRQLLEELDTIEGLDRVRFTSSNPHDMTQDILDAHFDLRTTCNYLHFALQSGNNTMLKKMNRRHRYEDFKKIVNYLRSRDPSFSISTDIIVGYSGESEDMFADTVKAFDECEFDFVFNARYSVRQGTAASKIYPDDVPDKIKAERWHTLNDKLLESIIKRNEKMRGNIEEVLVSGQKDGKFFGRTRNFKEVYFEPKNEDVEIGEIIKVHLKEVDRYIIHGEQV